MIMVTNEDRSPSDGNGHVIYHLQDLPGPLKIARRGPNGTEHRGHTLCGAQIRVQWFTWSPIPPTYAPPGWTPCASCLLLWAG